MRNWAEPQRTQPAGRAHCGLATGSFGPPGWSPLPTFCPHTQRLIYKEDGLSGCLSACVCQEPPLLTSRVGPRAGDEETEARGAMWPRVRTGGIQLYLVRLRSLTPPSLDFTGEASVYTRYLITPPPNSKRVSSPKFQQIVQAWREGAGGGGVAVLPMGPGLAQGVAAPHLLAAAAAAGGVAAGGRCAQWA